MKEPQIAYDRREVWGGYTFVEDVIEVHIFEEGLTLDLFGVLFSGS